MRIILTEILAIELQAYNALQLRIKEKKILQENWRCDILAKNVIICVNEKTLFTWCFGYTDCIEVSNVIDMIKKFQIDTEPIALIGYCYDNKTLQPIFNQIKKDALKFLVETNNPYAAMEILNNKTHAYLNNECPFTMHQLLTKDGDLKIKSSKKTITT